LAYKSQKLLVFFFLYHCLTIMSQKPKAPIKPNQTPQAMLQHNAAVFFLPDEITYCKIR